MLGLKVITFRCAFIYSAITKCYIQWCRWGDRDSRDPGRGKKHPVFTHSSLAATGSPKSKGGKIQGALHRETGNMLAFRGKTTRADDGQ